MRILGLLALLFLTPSVLPAASAAGDPASATPALPERYRRWLEDEVVYIISDYERSAFLKITDDAVRDSFIKAFWEARDPTQGTPRNEFQTEHYKRIADANRQFGQGKNRPGSKTERGRIYIQLGPPKDRSNYPMEAKLHPIEDWFYSGDPAAGMPGFFHVLFYRPHGVGDYEIYNPVEDGPESLVGGSVSGYVDRFDALRELGNVSIELETVSLSLIPSSPADVVSGHANSESGRFANKLRDLANHRPTDTAYVERVLGGKGRVEVDYSFRSQGLRSHFHGAFEKDGSPVLHYAIEVPPTSLTLERYDDRISGALEVVGRIFTEDGKTPVAELDEKVEISLSLAEFDQVKSSPFAFEDTVPLLPGKYQANLIVRNLVSREFGVVEGRFEVPEPPPSGGLAMSPLLIAAQSAPSEGEGYKPFVFGERIWHPAPDQVVVQKGELLAVFQVFYPAAKHTLGDALSVRYFIRAGEEEKLAGFDKVKLNPVFDQGITTGTIRAGLGPLPSGEYSLEVRVSGAPGESAARVAPFKIRFDARGTLPWVYSRKRARALGEAPFLLGMQALARGEEERGIKLLERVAADPDAGSYWLQARERLAELRIRRQEFAAAAAAIEPVVTGRDVQSQPWVLLALARSGQGKRAEAVAAYERALEGSPRSTRLLNALAEELIRAGDSARAAETLRRSLALDGEQEKVRELLARTEGGAPASP